MIKGLAGLALNSEAVSDADEEIFIVYTHLQQASTDLVGSDGFRGLGQVDSRKDTLLIQFELKPPAVQSDPQPERSKATKRKTKTKTKTLFNASTKTIEVDLFQDKTALRSRKGDTGSVLWRASIEFAQIVLQQHFFQPENPLFDKAALANYRVLELGAGTGLLSIVFSPLVRSYTVSDISDLLPLIRKNIVLNFPHGKNKTSSMASNISVEELDWLTLFSLPSPARMRYCPCPFDAPTEPWDLVLLVDCIYHPSLLPALVETIDVAATQSKSWVLVAVELRQEDVVREFLDLWLKKGQWTLWRLEGVLSLHYGIWMGQKGYERQSDL
ncbi:putative methyltransferase-domain-containing protein [Hygrophoropsis aurantiaca]|uniref:Methyltransferase-domain-containing protein n=1 Tax=Hygrophoropsis aurantiaca TaxID=72124 RepID=A0ACB8AKV1_9AGAM|nr:putative methyltransferase-domain-containing protein [Hygrophoropsis aurantiaca]